MVAVGVGVAVAVAVGVGVGVAVAVAVGVAVVVAVGVAVAVAVGFVVGVTMSVGNGTAPEVPPMGVALGLGPLWQPAPAAWDWPGTLSGPDGRQHHVLRFATATGVVGVLMDDDALRQLAAQATERSSGLTIAGPGDVPPAAAPRG